MEGGLGQELETECGQRQFDFSVDEFGEGELEGVDEFEGLLVIDDQFGEFEDGDAVYLIVGGPDEKGFLVGGDLKAGDSLHF